MLTAVDEHRRSLQAGGGAVARRVQRAEMAVHAVVLERVGAMLASAGGRAQLADAATLVAAGEQDHHHAAVAVLAWLAANGSDSSQG